MGELSLHTLWVEKYRPQNLDKYIGNEHLIKKAKVWIESGDIPHLLLYGKAGTGKTTLAKMLANSIECDHLYINASDERNVELVRTKIKNFVSTIGFKDMKVVLLDEADYITPIAQASMRNLMETFSKHARFILTCNYVERLIDPIQSRCQSFQIIPPSKKEVAVHLVNILKEEGVKHSSDDVVNLVNSGYPDIRRVINSAQRQVVNGNLVIDEQALIENDYKLTLIEILKKENKRDSFKKIRKLLADSKVTDFSDGFRLLYDTLDDWAVGHTAEAILTLAEGQRDDIVVVDKEINFMATMVKILTIIK